jgi:probable rRNA maturation factor
MFSIRVAITNLQSLLPVDADRLRRAVRHVFAQTRERRVQIGVAIVDDATIHALNVRHLQHDYPTDVLSYPLEDAPQKLVGEIVVSAETAERQAPHYGWSPEEELCLYVVHGALHLAGYRDKSRAQQQAMRAAERQVLSAVGFDCSPLAPREEMNFPEREGHKLPRLAERDDYQSGGKAAR